MSKTKERKTTEFGKLLLKYGIDHGLFMKDWAKIFDVSPSLISHIVTGRRSIPKDFKWIMKDSLNLDEKQLKELDDTITSTNKDFKERNCPTRKNVIVIYSDKKDKIKTVKDICGVLNYLDDTDIESLNKIISKHKEKLIK